MKCRTCKSAASTRAAAGGGGRRWSGTAMMNAPQASILAARAPSKARAAAAYMNSPMPARIVETWLVNLVGKGWQAQSQHPDPAIRRALNSEFEDLTLALLTVAVRDGEAFIRTSVGLGLPDGDRRAGLGSVARRAAVLPADQIDPSLTRVLGNGRGSSPGSSLTQTTKSPLITFCRTRREPRLA